jgi:hypothetical protein
VYYLDGKKATLIYVPNDISILADEKAREQCDLLAFDKAITRTRPTRGDQYNARLHAPLPAAAKWRYHNHSTISLAPDRFPRNKIWNAEGCFIDPAMD